ncbi:hypothetical protein C8J56DRAFT_488054 [Mycena floridula]|nr:hypothetical protein C8J56DRAFT_488054 [Mycena floridula]
MHQNFVATALHRVPVEVWHEIFVLFQRDPFAVIELGKVCAQWRHILISSPLLWSLLSVDLDQASKSGVDVTAKIIELHMARSAEVPMKVELWDGGRPSTANYLQGESALAVIELLVSGGTSHRWKDLSLNDLRLPWNDPLAGLAGNLPQLESLTISFPSPSHELDYRQIFTPFVVAPRLQKLTLSHFHRALNDVLDDFTGLMDQIKSLELRQFEMAAFKMLDHFPNMTRLLIEGPHCRVSTELPETSLKIEHLLVRKGCAMFLYLWLPHVTLPSLTTFSTKDIRSYGFFGAGFSDLLIRSACQITTLSFVNAILKEEDFLRILELTPELQTLVYNSPNYRVVDSALTQKVIGRLGWNSVDQVSLAKLESLDLSATIKNRGHILDMVRSRSLTKVVVRMRETELDSDFVAQAQVAGIFVIPETNDSYA